MFKHDPKVERLRDIELLAACSMQELRTIASTGDHVAARAGDVLPGLDRTFFLLTAGEATLGDEQLAAGDSCGALALLGGPVDHRTLRMRTDGKMLVVGPREFSSLMHRVPGFALGIAKTLARLIAA